MAAAAAAAAAQQIHSPTKSNADRKAKLTFLHSFLHPGNLLDVPAFSSQIAFLEMSSGTHPYMPFRGFEIHALTIKIGQHTAEISFGKNLPKKY